MSQVERIRESLIVSAIFLVCFVLVKRLTDGAWPPLDQSSIMGGACLVVWYFWAPFRRSVEEKAKERERQDPPR